VALLVLTAGVIAGATGEARAQPGESGAAAAESLFQEARKLMDAKRFAEACPKLAASHKLAPAVGTLLNLADCYERNGQLASAWVRFHEAIALAQRLGRADREKTATDRADKLEPRLIKLTIKSRESGLEVKLDGNVLDSAALGTAVPVDPGKHTIDATAKGKKPFNTIIDVSDRARTPSVDIPSLDADPDAKGTPPPPIETPKPPEEKSSDGSTQRILGIAGMGLGGAGVILGSIFGLRTSSKWSEAKDQHCTGTDCDRTGVELAAQAKNAGTVSTISFIAGGVFLAGGAVLFFTAPSGPPGPKKSDTTVGLGLGLGSVSLGGSF
jgi:hypothetical protein